MFSHPETNAVPFIKKLTMPVKQGINRLPNEKKLPE
jgi:hypothetical protein